MRFPTKSVWVTVDKAPQPAKTVHGADVPAPLPNKKSATVKMTTATVKSTIKSPAPVEAIVVVERKSVAAVNGHFVTHPNQHPKSVTAKTITAMVRPTTARPAPPVWFVCKEAVAKNVVVQNAPVA